jgi:proline dehydrogenase
VAHTGALPFGGVTARTFPEVGRLLGRTLPGRPVAGLRVDDALRAAAEAVASGRLVALEHLAGRGRDAAEIEELVERVHAAGLAAACDVTLPVDRLGADGAGALAAAAERCGIAVVLAGTAGAVDALAADLPEAGVVVAAGEPEAEDRCRALATRRVRLADGRGAAADLAFVRCLNVLMAASGRPGVATADPRLIAIAGERAAWNDRSPESWEYVMACGVRTEEQQRLVAAGGTVRAAVLTGRGAPAVLVRRLAGRS